MARRTEAVELENASPMLICGLTALSRAGFTTLEDVSSVLRDTSYGLPDSNKIASPSARRRSDNACRRPSRQDNHAKALSLRETEHMLAVALMGPRRSQLPTASGSGVSASEASRGKAGQSTASSAARVPNRVFL
mmetsp:Transcript_65081/g.121278  ORF Transcript_65081/g.121278 Transcript_65081/m.121278 type:complete len:135 (+) Transcript_65081:42-446(+)